MRLPWISRRVADLERENAALCSALEAECGRREALGRERDYWKARAEKLTDAALLRERAIDAPVMHPPEPSKLEQGRAALARGLASIGRMTAPTVPMTVPPLTPEPPDAS